MSARPDPARRRPGDSSPPALDYRREASERVQEAASCLRAFLDRDPQAIDSLTGLERHVVRSVLGRRWFERIERRADALDRIEAEAERAARPKLHVRFPGMRGDRDPVPEDNKERGRERRFTSP
jgi:hypothetical protein